MTKTREKSKAAFAMNVEFSDAVKGILGSLSDEQIIETIVATGKLANPPGGVETLEVPLQTLGPLAILASKTLAQELVLRARGQH